jgi:hypothetical protein
MRRDEIFRAVGSVFGRYFEVHPGCVKGHHDLRRDWGLDGYELQLLARQIEDYSGTELEDYAALADVRTIGQLVRLFRAHERAEEHSTLHAAMRG